MRYGGIQGDYLGFSAQGAPVAFLVSQQPTGRIHGAGLGVSFEHRHLWILNYLQLVEKLSLIWGRHCGGADQYLIG
jgi:hypothetical protein